MGKFKIAQVLASAGLNLGATTVCRMLKEPTPNDDVFDEEIAEAFPVNRASSWPDTRIKFGTSISLHSLLQPVSGYRGFPFPSLSPSRSVGGFWSPLIISQDAMSASPFTRRNQVCARFAHFFVEPSA